MTLPTRRDLIGGAAALIAENAIGELTGWPQVLHSGISIRQTEHLIELANHQIKATFAETSEGVTQEYFARRGPDWIKVVSALSRPNRSFGNVAPLYSNQQVLSEYRLLVASSMQRARIGGSDGKSASVILSGRSGDDSIEQTITLRMGENRFHVDVKAVLAGSPPRLEYLLSVFTFEAEKPDYTHAPHIKRDPADVIGDRSFHCPTTVLQKGSLLAALAPDLDTFNADLIFAPEARKADGPRASQVWQDPQTISMPTILDVDHKSGLSNFPVFSYGFADYLTQQHVYWLHENRKGVSVRTLSHNKPHYGFDLFVSADAQPEHGYQQVSRFMWEKYGSQYARQPKPQVMPFKEYARVCYPAAFKYRGDTAEDTARYWHIGPPLKNSERTPYDEKTSGPTPTWLEFELQGSPAGGIRTTPPWGYRDMMFSDLLNNVHLAQGMNWWGKKNADTTLLNKASRIIKLALSAPQKEGIFPGLYLYEQEQWTCSYWRPPGLPDLTGLPQGSSGRSGFYQTSWASNTAALLMRYHKYYDHDPRILSFLKPYGDFIISRTGADGCLPMWFTQDLVPVSNLRFNAVGGLHMHFLVELYQATGEEIYRKTALEMADFMLREILPQQRWYDWETFYSCSPKREDTYDARTGQWPRSTMSMLWAVEGFTACYEATGDKQLLDAAERAADYLALYQSVWQPQFIVTAYGFGGFVSQNSDAEWLDMRQCRCAEALTRLGVVTGRQDLLERGVAALRSGFALIHHPRNVANHIFPNPIYPEGISPENMDHEGIPQSCLRSGCDWGEGGALAAAAEISRSLGGIYINFAQNIAVGVDGVVVRRLRRSGKKIYLNIENQISLLTLPWESAFAVDLVLVGLKPGQYEMFIDDQPAIALSSQGETRISISVMLGSKTKPSPHAEVAI